MTRFISILFLSFFFHHDALSVATAAGETNLKHTDLNHTEFYHQDKSSAFTKDKKRDQGKANLDKLNQKVVNEMKLIVAFAKDSRKTYKDLNKKYKLSKSQKRNLINIEKENLNLLKTAEENIRRLEAD